MRGPTEPTEPGEPPRESKEPEGFHDPRGFGRHGFGGWRGFEGRPGFGGPNGHGPHDWWEHPHRGFRGFHPRRYVRAHLHRRIFFWFGASILITGLFAAAVSSLVYRSEGNSWSTEVSRLRTFAAGQFARVWDDPAQRDALAASVAKDLDVDVAVLGADGRVLTALGPPCERPFVVPVSRSGARLGEVAICADRHHFGPRGHFFAPFLVALVVLWAASGRIARRLTRPLADLARVAQDLGAGRLSSRARLCHGEGEVRVLAEAFNEMAGRIEKQIRDQRELLAAVSHELRTPLGHIRLLVELAREGNAGKTLDELDREVVEIDSLVGQLLAHSRLDFATLTLSQLDAAEVARRALERAGLDASKLAVEVEPAGFEGDATLVARAISNLVDNAQKHGQGLTALRVKGRPGFVAFEAEDRGAGFGEGEVERAFDAFYRKPKGGNERDSSLGLGLALVKRTAEAHGGTAYAGNRESGGAVVGFEVPVAAAVQAEPRA